MAGTGLEGIMQSTFAGVPKLPSGKKFPQNIRALRMVVEELLRPPFAKTDLQTMVQLKSHLHQYCTKSMTSKMWVDCLIPPMFIVLLFVRAEGEGDWPLHLLAVEEMMPYCFASGHFKYARYGRALVFTIDAASSSDKHVMRHTGGLRNGVLSDLFIGSYGHGPSGIISSTLNETTLAKWAPSHNTLGQMTNGIVDLDDQQKRSIHISEDTRAEDIREAIA